MEKSNEATSFKQAMQSMFGGEVTLILGTVTKEDPIEVTAAGDEKLIISEEILVIPEHLTDHTIETTTTTTNGWGVELGKKKVIVHGKLKKNDEVALLALAHGKHYFVLDRM